jgi:hypothetical protein
MVTLTAATAGRELRPLLEQADVSQVTRQVHLALFYEARLDLKAMEL